MRKSQSYKETEIQSYKATDTIFLEDLFSSEEKATELQRYRATGTYFFRRKKSYKDTKKVTKLCNFVTFETKGLLGKSYRVTELQGYRHQIFFGRKKIMTDEKKSYRVTELQSYRPQFFSSGNQVTKLQQKLQSYITS